MAVGFSTKGEDSERDLTAHDNLTEQVKKLTELIAKFDAEHKDNPTFCYWREYMHLVSILLRFTRALREGDWELYLSSFAEMLPWFAAFDQVHRGFQQGDFETKKTCKTFNQIPDDQALKHVNKTGKIAGGLVGITWTDSTRDHWCLTYNERAQLSEDTKALFDVGSQKGDEHKDIGKARRRRDKEDVLKLVFQFTK